MIVSLAQTQTLVRQAYRQNRYLGLCQWFESFKQALLQYQFETCQGLLDEIRGCHYPISPTNYPLAPLELRYVNSHAGALYFQQGIAHHKQQDWQQALSCYEQSLELQQQVECVNCQRQIELVRSLLESHQKTGQIGAELANSTCELEVLGSSTFFLRDCWLEFPEDRASIVTAAQTLKLQQALFEMVQANDEQVRMMGISVLSTAQFETEQDRDSLLKQQIQGLQDHNWFFRWRSAATIGEQLVGNPQGESLLCEAIAQETDPEVRSSLILSLGRLGDRQRLSSHTVATLTQTLSDLDSEVRSASIAVLAKFGDPSVLRPLSQMEGKNFWGYRLHDLAEAAKWRIAMRHRLNISDRTITVDQSGNGQYLSISDAIANAQPNTRILVYPGHYRESLIIDRPLAIVGEGSKTEVIIESCNATCISIQTDYAFIRNVTIECRADTAQTDGAILDLLSYAIAIPQGDVVIDQCDIAASIQACISCNENTTVKIRDSHIHGSLKGSGIRIKSSKVEIENCEIYDNQSSGIYGTESHQIFIQNCKIYRHLQVAVKMLKSNPVIQNCHIHTNKHGFEIVESSPILQNCKIYQGEIGAVFSRSSQGTVEQCQFFDHTKSGIKVQRSNPKIHSCQIYDSHRGVHFTEAARGEMNSCEIYQNRELGILVDTSANPHIHHCQLHHGNAKGIRFTDDATGLVDSCQIFSNVLVGIEIDQTSQPKILHSQISQGNSGIYSTGQSKGVMEDCTIYSHSGDGVKVLQSGNLALKDCMIVDNFDGISISAQGQITATNCLIESQRKSGIRNQGGEVRLSDCEIKDNKGDGLYSSDRSRSIVDDCHIHASSASGIHFYKNSQGQITNCRIERNQSGVVIDDSSEAIVSDCQIHDNQKSGLMICENSRSTLRNCQIDRNQSEGIFMLTQSHLEIENCSLAENGQAAWNIDGSTVNAVNTTPSPPLPPLPPKQGLLKRWFG
jgi:parallel beta-helix repeat protein